MPRTLASKFVILFSALIVAGGVEAQHAEMSSNAQEAEALLKKIQTAAQKQNFAGTFVYQQGNQISTSRIAHRLEGKSELEKLEILDGKPREYIRSNEEIVCYVPESKTLVIEKREAHDIFPAILASDLVGLTDYYRATKGESARVAGHEVQALILEPKDNLRYGYRLWADKATGLLLRAQTLNEKREIVEQITFTQITIGGVDKSRVKPSFRTVGWRVENAVMSQSGSSGWAVKSVPVGFKKIREVKRIVSDALPLLPPNSLASTSAVSHRREVFQMVFSDGLAAISVFIEPGVEKRVEGSVQQGAMNITGKRQGDFWLTVIGEVPYAAIKQVANSVEFQAQ